VFWRGISFPIDWRFGIGYNQPSIYLLAMGFSGYLAKPLDAEFLDVMSPLWDIITGQRFMMTRIARWVLERVHGYLRGIVGSILH
jgi:hypothetical protein